MFAFLASQDKYVWRTIVKFSESVVDDYILLFEGNVLSYITGTLITLKIPIVRKSILVKAVLTSYVLHVYSVLRTCTCTCIFSFLQYLDKGTIRLLSENSRIASFSVTLMDWLTEMAAASSHSVSLCKIIHYFNIM